jgi:hypothetical protein
MAPLAFHFTMRPDPWPYSLHAEWPTENARNTILVWPPAMNNEMPTQRADDRTLLAKPSWLLKKASKRFCKRLAATDLLQFRDRNTGTGA